MEAVTENDAAKQKEIQAALATAISQVQGKAIALNYLTKDAYMPKKSRIRRKARRNFRLMQLNWRRICFLQSVPNSSMP
jgi:hypothetical protein